MNRSPGKDRQILTEVKSQHSSGLADSLRELTRPWHQEAERTGVVYELLKGRASRQAYALLLRNLLPVYERLEEELEHHRDLPVIGTLAEPAIYRSAAIQSDLKALTEQALSELPILPSSKRYVDRIKVVSESNACGLVAHAYTRFLGDLNGGQILRKLLSESLKLGPEALSFYQYPDDLPRTFKVDYRKAIDRAAERPIDREFVMKEAVNAFKLNIDLSNAVLQASAR